MGEMFALTFPEERLKYLADKDKPIEEWMKEPNYKRNAKVSSGLKYLPDRKFIDKILRKPKAYAIRPQNSIQDIAYRSYKDFQVLRHSLLKKFPGALVPFVPKSKTQSKSSMGLFLAEIVNNRFFYHDEVTQLFLDKKVKNYSSTIRKMKRKNSFKPSEGSIRWLQMKCTFGNNFSEDYQKNETFVNQLRDELKLYNKHLRDLHSNVEHQMSLQESQAVASSELHTTLQSVLSLESNIDVLNCEGNEESIKKLISTSKSTAGNFHRQTSLLRKQYGAPALQKSVLNRIEQQQSLIDLWLNIFLDVERHSKALSRAKSELKGLSNDKKRAIVENKIRKLKTWLLNMYQGTLGFELHYYQAKRPRRMEEIISNLTQFHVRGAEKTLENWHIVKKCKEVSLDEFNLKETCVDKLRKRNELKISKNLITKDSFQPMVIRVKDCVKKRYNSVLNRTKVYLTVEAGEILIAHRIPENSYMNKYSKDCVVAINKHGKKGLVDINEVEEVKNSKFDWSSAFQQPQQQPPEQVIERIDNIDVISSLSNNKIENRRMEMPMVVKEGPKIEVSSISAGNKRSVIPKPPSSPPPPMKTQPKAENRSRVVPKPPLTPPPPKRVQDEEKRAEAKNPNPQSKAGHPLFPIELKEDVKAQNTRKNLFSELLSKGNDPSKTLTPASSTKKSDVQATKKVNEKPSLGSELKQALKNRKSVLRPVGKLEKPKVDSGSGTVLHAIRQSWVPDKTQQLSIADEIKARVEGRRKDICEDDASTIVSISGI